MDGRQDSTATSTSAGKGRPSAEGSRHNLGMINLLGM